MNHILKILVVFIVAVAVYDIYCTVRLHDTLLDFEENRVAASLLTSTNRHIIHAKYGHYVDFKTVDVSLLVTIKAAGLAASVALLQLVVCSMRPRMAAAIVFPIAAGMAGLLIYLLF